jgi:hypothetical protein
MSPADIAFAPSETPSTPGAVGVPESFTLPIRASPVEFLHMTNVPALEVARTTGCSPVVPMRTGPGVHWGMPALLTRWT